MPDNPLVGAVLRGLVIVGLLWWTVKTMRNPRALYGRGALRGVITVALGWTISGALLGAIVSATMRSWPYQGLLSGALTMALSGALWGAIIGAVGLSRWRRREGSHR
jgi:hypothetical protein